MTELTRRYTYTLIWIGIVTTTNLLVSLGTILDWW
jgi:hypothetical protein